MMGWGVVSVSSECPDLCFVHHVLVPCRTPESERVSWTDPFVCFATDVVFGDSCERSVLLSCRGPCAVICSGEYLEERAQSM